VSYTGQVLEDGAGPATLTLYYVEDACSALPASTPDLADYAVLYERGGCAVTDQFGNLISKGAKHLLAWK
jgi:hypothetical protein